jgi:8-oxo-dGTP diphosphatase
MATESATGLHGTRGARSALASLHGRDTVKQRATVVCRMGTRILLVGKANSRWSLPGGKPDAGETLEAAAVRELMEETRLQAMGMQYLFEFAGARTCHHVFAAHVDEQQTPVPSNEITRCTWAKVTDISDLDTSVSTRGIVDVLALSRNYDPRVQSRYQRADAFVQNLREALHDVRLRGWTTAMR